jgi:hypothetical protein
MSDLDLRGSDALLLILKQIPETQTTEQRIKASG